MNEQLSIPGNAIQLRSMAEMAEFAAMVHRSKLAPKDLGSPEAVMVAMQHGMELGLSPLQAVQSIAVINGRPVVWGDAALALVRAHPECEDVWESFEESEDPKKKLARCEVLRRGKKSVVRTFSVDDAERAGLLDGPVWKKYPRRMMQMRARAFALRDAFPDALKGVGISEEVQDIPRANAREVQAPAIQFADQPALPAPIERSDNDLDQP